jgi:hypothetical protein
MVDPTHAHELLLLAAKILPVGIAIVIGLVGALLYRAERR